MQNCNVQIAMAAILFVWFRTTNKVIESFPFNKFIIKNYWMVPVSGKDFLKLKIVGTKCKC